MDSEIEYGFTLAEGPLKLQPYGSVSLTERNSNEVRLGNRCWTGECINFEIEGLETIDSRINDSRYIRLTETSAGEMSTYSITSRFES